MEKTKLYLHEIFKRQLLYQATRSCNDLPAHEHVVYLLTAKCSWQRTYTCTDDAVAHVTLPGHFPRPGHELHGLPFWGVRAPTRRDSRHRPSRAPRRKLATPSEEAREAARERGGSVSH